MEESKDEIWEEDLDLGDFDKLEIGGIDEIVGSEIEEEKRNLELEFVDLFTSYSFTNITYAKLAFHVIVGQLFKNVKFYLGNRPIDMRVHLFYVSDSGSGKSSAISFIKNVANSLNIPTAVIRGEVSEAGLIGSYVLVRKIEDGKAVDKIELQEGVLKSLANGGIIIFDEAGFVLKSEEKQYTKNLLGYLQAAMDEPPNNLITKITALGEIVFSPLASFIFLTYPIPFKIMEVLRGGFFQRLILYFRKVSKVEWENIKNEYLRKLAEENIKLDLSTNIQYTNLINELREIKEWVENSKPQLKFTKEAKEFLNNFYKKFDERYGKFEGEKGDLFNSFRIRSMVEICKLAGHYAILNRRDKVVLEDVEKASNLIFDCLDSLVSFLEWASEAYVKKESWEIYWERVRKEWYVLVRRLKVDSNGFCPLEDFKNLISEFCGVSSSSAYRLIDVWARKGLIVKEGRMVKIR